MTKHHEHPELIKGIRIQYKDKNEAGRTGKIVKRKGRTLTVLGSLMQKSRVDIGNVTGYWKGKGKASPENMIKLEG